MYAHLSTNHQPMHRCEADVTSNPDKGILAVRANFGNDLYLSFPADEARRAGEALLAAADKADRMQKRLDAINQAEAEAEPCAECGADPGERHERICSEWEPTDNEIANRHGVEGGVGYTDPPALSEHDPRL